MRNHLYLKKVRQWAAVFLSALLALGIIVCEPVFSAREQPHLGQDRGDESSLNLNAPSIYDNASATMTGYTWRPGSLVSTIILPPRT